MKTVVIYKSKTGFAKKYAEWIAEALEADLLEYSKVSDDIFLKYETIIYGGGLYVVGINGVKLILKNLDKLKDKKIIVFASGATPNREETTIEIRDKNFTVEQQKVIRFFYLRGGFDFSKLGIVDKMLMVLLKIKLRMKSESKRSPDEKGMLEAYNAPSDFTKRKYMDELLNYALDKSRGELLDEKG